MQVWSESFFLCPGFVWFEVPMGTKGTDGFLKSLLACLYTGQRGKREYGALKLSVVKNQKMSQTSYCNSPHCSIDDGIVLCLIQLILNLFKYNFRSHKPLCTHVYSLQLCLPLCDPMDIACQTPLSRGFSRQEH